jgi:hypothetical protein
MLHIVQAEPFVVNFSDDAYATIDRAQGVVTVHEGQRLGLDTDWGGKIVACLTFAQAEAIANALYVPWSQPDQAYKDVQPAQERADYIGD